ncbi:MAG: HypC/HybG/HupF family hydrogenase formation chaperone [Planctomycetales bacterium]|nr:HypC/HybG/HupF family hydrogenase formation chaperone [Planctomycetales bacterium]MCA9166420.1 HypC/HybG/HupF family hydrogenase formation chaperone [Planctomycetales bacterium]
MCLAVPGQIETCFEQDGLPMATVNFGGVRKNVCLAYVPDAVVGEYVIVHVGFALHKLDEQAAQETLTTFAEMERALESEDASP